MTKPPRIDMSPSSERSALEVESLPMKLTNRITVLVVLAALLWTGCSASRPPQQVSLRYGKHWDLKSLDSVLAQAGPGEVEVVTLGNTAWVSHHVAVVRTQERPHYHRFHDLTVVVLRGEGVLRAGQKEIPMYPGDVAHIPRGETHFFRNTGDDPAVAFVSFSPPFDRRDVVSAEDEVAGEEGKETKDDDGGDDSGGWFW